MATYISDMNDQQKLAFAKVVNGESVFLTGPAGTGKSYVVQKIRDYWTDTGRKFLVTAPTGVAAILIGGRTFHSTFWLRPDDEAVDVTPSMLRDRLMQTWPGKKLIKSFQSVSSIIIDEVSMMSATMLAKVSEMLKLVRFNGGAFGGIQIVLVGDFFQLAPVSREAFMPLWRTAVFYEMVHTMVSLEAVCYRQPNREFFDLLSRLRKGQVTEEDIEVLRQRLGANVSKNGVVPTILFATNRDVDEINAAALADIASEAVVFKRHVNHRPAIHNEALSAQLEKFLRDLREPSEVVLKGPGPENGSPAGSVGAQVMLTYNLAQEHGLVNGSRGVVVDFVEPDRKQAAHKSIFEDFDCDDSSQRQVYIKGLKMPKVRFLKHDGSHITILVPYVRYERRLEDHKMVYAWCLPLRLAWASTVHKSQGQSLDCVSIALDHSFFAEGQAYVAISRARSLEGLTFTAFDPRSIRASAEVIQFYSQEFGTFRPT